MTPFELAEPRTLRDALALLDPDDATVRPISGGTAVMLMMKAGVLRPRRLVSLRSIDGGLAGIGLDADGGLRIGAMTPLAELERSETVRKGWPVIARTLRTLSNVRVRNVATIGGHLAHGDPHQDLPPVLSALGARVAVAGPKGERTVPVERLVTGYYETVLARDELITAVSVPALGKKRAAYLKCTTRSADDWPALGMAVALETEGDAIRTREHRHRRGDRQTDPAPRGRERAPRRARRRGDARAGGRRGGRRARDRRRYARFGGLQEAARPRLPPARGARRTRIATGPR